MIGNISAARLTGGYKTQKACQGPWILDLRHKVCDSLAPWNVSD